MDKTIQKFFTDILNDKTEPAPAVKPSEPVVKAEPVKEVKPAAQPKVNPKLAAYIAEEIKLGISKADIKKGLLAAKWPEKDVDAALL